MKVLEVEGNVPLLGSVEISGAKNSAVALIPTAILSDKKTTITNIPDITDIDVLCDILEFMHVKVTRASGSLVIDPSEMQNLVIPDEANVLLSFTISTARFSIFSNSSFCLSLLSFLW